MADQELLLTIGGVDVTEDVWQWRSVRLTDSWTSHPTLSFTLRQAFGSAVSPVAYADVRLVNLLTSECLFEGIVAPGPLEQRDVDPTWVETDVTCVGYQALFDTSVLQVAVDIPMTNKDYTTAIVRALVDVSFADSRVRLPITQVVYDVARPVLAWETYGEPGYSAARLSSLAAALAQVVEESGLAPSSLAFPFDYDHPHVAKVVPGLGIVLTPPDYALRGTAPVALTAAAFGRPTACAQVVDTTQAASGVIEDLSAFGDPDIAIRTAPGAPDLNGYLVVRDTISTLRSQPLTYFTLHGGKSEFYRIVSPPMPHDVLVGHEITFDTARLGSVTGIVQSVQTSFDDGVYDQSSANWPHFLDSGRNLDGTWNLDASVSSVIPRRRRVSTMTVASSTVPGVPRGMVQRLRRTRSL